MHGREVGGAQFGPTDLSGHASASPHQTGPRLSPGTRLSGSLRRVPLSGPSQALSPPVSPPPAAPQPSRSSPPAPLPCRPVLPSTHSVPRSPRAAAPWPPTSYVASITDRDPLGGRRRGRRAAREPGACACTAASSPTSRASRCKPPTTRPLHQLPSHSVRESHGHRGGWWGQSRDFRIMIYDGRCVRSPPPHRTQARTYRAPIYLLL